MSALSLPFSFLVFALHHSFSFRSPSVMYHFYVFAFEHLIGIYSLRAPLQPALAYVTRELGWLCMLSSLLERGLALSSYCQFPFLFFLLSLLCLVYMYLYISVSVAHTGEPEERHSAIPTWLYTAPAYVSETPPHQTPLPSMQSRKHYMPMGSV